MRIILSGAAPLSAHVEEFLRVVACCHVLQGYGILSLKLAFEHVIFPFSLLLWTLAAT